LFDVNRMVSGKDKTHSSKHVCLVIESLYSSSLPLNAVGEHSNKPYRILLGVSIERRSAMPDFVFYRSAF
jgi:hypothetical protein